MRYYIIKTDNRVKSKYVYLRRWTHATWTTRFNGKPPLKLLSTYLLDQLSVKYEPIF